MGFLSEALNTTGGGSGDGIKGIVDKVKGALSKRDAGTNSKGAGDLEDNLGMMSTGLASAKKGGTVKKTGYIKMHKGEKVTPKKSSPRKRA